jgi:hypothetical protein
MQILAHPSETWLWICLWAPCNFQWLPRVKGSCRQFPGWVLCQLGKLSAFLGCALGNFLASVGQSLEEQWQHPDWWVSTSVSHSPGDCLGPQLPGDWMGA